MYYFEMNAIDDDDDVDDDAHDYHDYDLHIHPLLSISKEAKVDI